MRRKRPAMANTLFRSASFEAGTGRTLYGLAVPFGDTITVNDGGASPYKERFAPGSTSRTARERGHKIRLFTQHDRRRLPIGRATRLEETARGLEVEFDVANTVDGDDALELVRTGVIDAFSVGFTPIRAHWDGDVLVRDEVALGEVSLVSDPAYPGALVGGIRSQQLHIPADVAARRLRLLDL